MSISVAPTSVNVSPRLQQPQHANAVQAGAQQKTGQHHQGSTALPEAGAVQPGSSVPGASTTKFSKVV